MVKIVFSVVAGYAVMILATFALFGALARIAPDRFGREAAERPGTGFLLFILVYGLGAALAGGWTTATIVPTRGAVLGLVGLVAAMGLLMLFGPSDEAQPAWYRAALLVVGVAGAALGGWLCLAR